MAAIYLESGNLTKAFSLLEELLTEDKGNLYIRGCVVKQGTLGHYYLRQGEFKDADRILLSALAFIQKRDESLLNEDKGSSYTSVGWDYEVRISIMMGG